MSRLFLSPRGSRLQLRSNRSVVSVVAAMFSLIAIGLQAQHPPYTSTVLAKARHLRASHQPQAAESLLHPYLAAHPNDPEALTLLGQLRIDQGDPAGAEKQFLSALTTSPNSIAANLAMGDLLLSMHRNPEAMDRYETVLAVARANSNARHGEVAAATELALSARRSGHPEVAFEVLQHAGTKLPTSIWLTPASTIAPIQRSFASVGIICFSICSPSRGPTSRTVTLARSGLLMNGRQWS